MKGYYWTPAEASFLDSLAGDVPFPEVVRRFRKFGAQHGWPHRSERAMFERLRRTRQMVRARTGAYLTTGGVAEILGCPASRVGGWLKRQDVAEILQPLRIGHFNYIERRAWRRLAREMPQVLGGFSADRLFVLLEDHDLVEAITDRCRSHWGDRRIRCIETGRVYASCTAAARELHVHYSTISLAITQCRPVTSLGLRFQRVRQTPAASRPAPGSTAARLG